MACSQDAVEALQASTHILSCIPPSDGPTGDQVCQKDCLCTCMLTSCMCTHDGFDTWGQVIPQLCAELQQCRGTAQWVGYLSSTGVYGDWEGDWVDERCSSAHACSARRAQDTCNDPAFCGAGQSCELAPARVVLGCGQRNSGSRCSQGCSASACVQTGR